MTPKRRFQGTSEYPEGLVVGIDVGSTTVKAVVVNAADPAGTILWTDYRRHETRQQELCLDFLERIEQAFPGVPPEAMRVFGTGTGGATLCQQVGGYFVQEVNALCLVVGRRFPRVRSVIELGGEDAKIIVFKIDPVTGIRRKSASMNDKCAGGTGAVIDKISAKLCIDPSQIGQMRYDGLRVHPVAGKCGVFAETDINGLQKQGVPAEELMASLFESLIRQNLSVLARGNTLHPDVLLLGGPNTFIRGIQECWRRHLPRIWEERGVEFPADTPPETLIHVPRDGLLFAALGATEYARAEISENREIGVYQGTDQLRWYLDEGRTLQRGRRPGVAIKGVGETFGQLAGLAGTREELSRFRERYRRPPWAGPPLDGHGQVEAFLGIDGGSTSTKAVLIDCEKRVLAKSYRLSLGNPIEDMQGVVGDLEQQIERQGCRLRILGTATTGYAKDMLRSVARTDVALVETVAHMQSGLLYYPGADVICDVGGQDIKVIILKNGVVKDFRLNTQCSAGNGFYLQSTAAAFGFSVEEYAEQAFTAETMPQFSYGCAVFLQTDIVDFQRQGWRPNEILAGLAAVLPKNIWLYVCQMPNLARLGRTFILQGGTQHNLAAVKAQADFIHSRFEGSGVTPEVVVHPHCGESGAIGCALEALRLYEERPYETSFIGLDALQSIRYTTRRDETTRCSFCTNKCMRTFIEVEAGHSARKRQVIIANCEKGAVENVADAREISARERAVQAANTNMAAVCAREVFKPVEVDVVADPPPRTRWLALPWRRGAANRRRALIEARKGLRIGMPRALNMYLNAPFFTGYFMSLGIPAENLVWSDYTTDDLFKEGAKRGSIDPCYPSKLAIAHVHNLLYKKHGHGHELTHLFFPVVDTLPTWLHGVLATRACPTSMATIEATHAAFVKETDLFAERGLRFKRTFINLDNARLCARQMCEDWADDLGVTEAESARAVEQGLCALRRYQEARRREARQVLEIVRQDQRLAIVVLARPYHNDPGINQGILEQFQKRGYPILTHDTLPLDDDIVLPLFGAELRAGAISSPFSIDDVWKNTFAENSSRKLWAAKFGARHRHLVGLELSNFKCGHDAPTYAAIEEIFECSGSPFFYFKEIDENRPAGTIKLRVETISYFLDRYRERLLKSGKLEPWNLGGSPEEADPMGAELSTI